MRTLISLFLILTTTLVISQTKQSNVKVNLEIDAVFNKITVNLKSKSGELSNCIVQITDSKKNIVKTVDLPKATNKIESTIMIVDLAPGNYTCFVYKEKEELYKKEFFKDALYAEPMGAINTKN